MEMVAFRTIIGRIRPNSKMDTPTSKIRKQILDLLLESSKDRVSRKGRTLESSKSKEDLNRNLKKINWCLAPIESKTNSTT
jgi:hypothetical protein